MKDIDSCSPKGNGSQDSTIVDAMPFSFHLCVNENRLNNIIYGRIKMLTQKLTSVSIECETIVEGICHQKFVAEEIINDLSKIMSTVSLLKSD